MSGAGDREFMLPVSRNDLLPRGKRDRSLFIVMLVMTPAIFAFDVLFVLPKISNLVFLHVSLALYILINIAVNMAKLVESQPSARELPPGVLPSALLPNWFYCHECHLNVPPRSYHCRVCDACILKQDHHCMFAGKCVGFGNQRYFVVGVFYIFVGCIYSLTMHLDFTITYFMGGYRWGLLVVQFAPHLGWIFGSLDMYGCFIACLNLFEFCVVIFSAVLLWAQIACIVNNQTMYERKHDVKKYKHFTLTENLEEVFGDHYIAVWFWPVVESKPRGDGIHFKSYDRIEDRKSL